MKPLKYAIASVLIVTLISATVDAQDNVKLGRGRLLRKWRDDLIGKTDDKPAQKKQSVQTAQDSNQQPTPAQRPTATESPSKSTAATRQTSRSPQSSLPTASQQANSNQYRSQQSQQPPNRQPQSRSQTEYGIQSAQSQSARPASSRLPVANQNSAREKFATQAQPVASASSNSVAAIGFGMKVEAAKDNSLVISQIDPRGNAAEAGLKRGDQIVELGGIELSAIEEYNGIVGILGQGDQLELKVLQKGQAKKVNLMFGQPKEVESPGTETITDEVTRAVEQPGRKAPIGTGVGYSKVSGDYDFVPQAQPESSQPYQSVLEQNSRNRTAQSNKL